MAFVFFSVIMDVHLPAGILGPDPVSYDVRAFLLPHDEGVTLIDTRFDPEAGAVADGLSALGLHWSDVTDIIITHGHVDHVGGLGAITASAPSAAVWAGRGDSFTTPVQRLADGDVIRGLRVVTTPGHTPGHVSLFEEAHKVLFAGDVVGSMRGHLRVAPEQFTDNAQEMMRSVRRLAQFDLEGLIVSHGEELPDPVAALADLLARSKVPS